MFKKCLLVNLVIAVALPTIAFAVGMGGMGGSMGGSTSGGTGGMPRMVDKISIQTQTVGNVVFSHSLHGRMHSCSSCHPKLFKKKSNSNHVSMKAMERGRSCGGCHNGRIAFSVKGDCVRCHAGDLELQDSNIGKTAFSHSLHLDMDFGCSDCHPDLFKARLNGNKMTMNAMEQGEFCGACHDGDSAFSVKSDCTSCHAGEIKWKNEDAGDTVFSHSAHLEMDFGCSDCHPDLFKARHPGQKMTMESMSNGAYCGACHDGSSAFSVEENCESCHQM